MPLSLFIPSFQSLTAPSTSPWYYASAMPLQLCLSKQAVDSPGSKIPVTGLFIKLVIGDILVSWLRLRLLLQPVLSCHRDVGFSRAWHHSGSLAWGSDVRNLSLRRSAMQC